MKHHIDDEVRLSASREARAGHYQQRKAHPSNRNIGPRPTFPRLKFHVYFVCTDIALSPGSIINGSPVPEGSRLMNYPLARPTASRRRVKQKLAKIRQRVPGAFVLESWRAEPVTRATSTASLVLGKEVHRG